MLPFVVEGDVDLQLRDDEISRLSDSCPLSDDIFNDETRPEVEDSKRNFPSDYVEDNWIVLTRLKGGGLISMGPLQRFTN